MSKVIRTCIGISEWTGEYWCDSCGRRIPQVTTVKGMDFCPKCYQETFGETDKDKKITELQQQLAEKDKEIENVEREKELDNIFWKQECDSLQKVLAEKDKEIEKLECMIKTLPEHDKEIKQLICEKIREFVKDENLGNDFIEMSEKAFNKKLDQIEKGE